MVLAGRYWYDEIDKVSNRKKRKSRILQAVD